MKMSTAGLVPSLALVLAAACGDDEATIDAAPAIDASIDAPTASLSIQVRRFTWDLRYEPEPNALVAIDLPDGTRIERNVDADGLLELTDLPWAEGTASVTTWVENAASGSVTGVPPGGLADLVVMELAPPPDEVVTLSGTVQNMTDESNSLYVFSSMPGTVHSGTGPDWSLAVPADTPCTLAAYEIDYGSGTGGQFNGPILTWAFVEQGAVVADTVVDVDLAVPGQPLVSVAGTVQLGLDTDSPVYGSALYWDVGSATNMGFRLGSVEHSVPGAEAGTRDFDGRYAELAGVTPATFYMVGSNQHHTAALVDGFPTAGPFDPGFLEMPRILSPTTPDLCYPIGEVLAWETPPEDAYARLLFMDGDGIHWGVMTQAGDSQLVIPPPPTGTTFDDVLGTGPFAPAVLQIFTIDGPEDVYLRKYSQVTIDICR